MHLGAVGEGPDTGVLADVQLPGDTWHACGPAGDTTSACGIPLTELRPSAQTHPVLR